VTVSLSTSRGLTAWVSREAKVSRASNLAANIKFTATLQFSFLRLMFRCLNSIWNLEPHSIEILSHSEFFISRLRRAKTRPDGARQADSSPNNELIKSE
jgi:hypothetical protein